MMTLPSLLGSVVTILQSSPLIQRIDVLETKVFAGDQFFFKVRAEISEIYQLQVCIYVNRGHTDYAYQLFSDIPLLHWDNKEEFPHLLTYPHHYHDDVGHVLASPLEGDPLNDLPRVFQYLSEWFNQRRNAA